MSADDQLDDGSPICLTVKLDAATGGAVFDFTGTSPQVRRVFLNSQVTHQIAARSVSVDPIMAPL